MEKLSLEGQYAQDMKENQIQVVLEHQGHEMSGGGQTV